MTDSKPSKTALKKQQAELQQLGERLIDIEESELRAMDLDDALLDAVLTAKNIRAHGGLRRQKQLIGKLMRQVDAAPIRAALDARGNAGRSAKRRFAVAERWRDRILADGVEAIAAFQAETTDSGDTLTRLYADYARAGSDRAEKTAKRAIFRHVHDVLTAGSA